LKLLFYLSTITLDSVYSKPEQNDYKSFKAS